jgi:hypothetical protein
MRRLLAAAALAAAALAPVSFASACELPADFGARADTLALALAYRPVPAPIVVGKHFAVDVAVCAKAGAPAPVALRVDAQMPEHRHGMNYRAQVKPQGPGRWRAEGLMFHMPGRWQFVFDVESGGRHERLVHDYRLE